jgi:hypothetical protein
LVVEDEPVIVPNVHGETEDLLVRLNAGTVLGDGA